jgi:putative sigma-54 modulation protein
LQDGWQKRLRLGENRRPDDAGDCIIQGASSGAETQAYVTEKAEKLLTYFDRVTAIQVTFDFSNNSTTAEILVDAEHKHNFVAVEVAPQAAAAFDLALHKMEEQIRRYKDRIQDHHRRMPPVTPEIEEEAEMTEE